MESPPNIMRCSTSAWSGLSSEDSGFLLTNSNNSLSSCSGSNWQFTMELIDSDNENNAERIKHGVAVKRCNKTTVSSNEDYIDCDDDDDDDEEEEEEEEPLYDSVNNDTSSSTDTDQYNTLLKKGGSKFNNFNVIEPIDPPLEFQDVPVKLIMSHNSLEQLAEGIIDQIVGEAVYRSEKECSSRLCCTPEPIYSSSLSRRPASRNSLNSRLSSSHNSLSVPTANKADDSSFITSAMSHDVLDMYNVPLDSDIYTLPVDSLKQPSLCPQRPKRQNRHHRKRRRNVSDNMLITTSGTAAIESNLKKQQSLDEKTVKRSTVVGDVNNITNENDISLVNEENKRHSIAGTGVNTIKNGIISNGCTGNDAVKVRVNVSKNKTQDRHNKKHSDNEPIHMTLHEVRQFLQNLYSTATLNQSNRDVISNGTLSLSPSTNNDIARISTTNNDNNSDSGRDFMNNLSRNNSKLRSSNNKKHNNKHNYVNNNNKINTNTLAIHIKNNKKSNRLYENSTINNNNNNNNNNRNNNNNKCVGRLNDVISSEKAIKKQQSVLLERSNNEKQSPSQHGCSKSSFTYTFKQTLCNIFRFRRSDSNVTVPSSPVVSPTANCDHNVAEDTTLLVLGVSNKKNNKKSNSSGSASAPLFTKRALPPLPLHEQNGDNTGMEDRLINFDGNVAETENGENDSTLLDGNNIITAAGENDEEEEEISMDFASSIEKVKDYGWYWGPICGESAEKILSNEPDGSFIVRDSSDDHYIFSLTFKLNGVVRHVRIEHDQGNFSFGSCTKFKSHTIVEFIENAVEHSRSGRYLFFLHRRPIHGPMRVQLLHPVSRFKQVQSLQHMCRFVILKVVRKDLISSLPLPRRIIDYLNSPHYYSEHPSVSPICPAATTVANSGVDELDRPSSSPSLHLFSFVPPNS